MIFNMAIASPTRTADLEHYAVMADIIETTHRLYLRDNNPEYLPFLTDFITYLEELKVKIDNYDYSEEDKRFWAHEAFLKSYPQMPSESLTFTSETANI